MDEQLLIKVIDGAATEAETTMVAEWLEASPENRELYFRIKDILDVQRTGGYSIDAAAAWRKVSAKTSRGIPVWRAAAAVLLLAAGISGAWYFFGGRQAPEMEMVVAKEQRRETLPDGTVLWLRPGASYRFGSGFGKTDRNVEVTGTAYFEAAAAALPFIVNIQGMEVQVLGTRFTVAAGSVVVQEGKVKAVSGTEEVVVMPDERVSAAGGKLVKEKVNAGLFAAWKDGEYTFSNTSLQEISSMIKNNYGYDVEIKQPESFAGTAISGHVLIDSDEALQTVLSSMLYARVNKNGNTIIIQPR